MNLRPYLELRWGFRGEGGGIDCWQLVCRAGRELFGRDYPDDFALEQAELAQVFAHERQRWLEVDRAAMEPGDVVLLTLRGEPVHAGIMVDRRRFLHIMPGAESTLGDIDGLAWRHRIGGFFRCRK